ncbi:hypothetical protein [Metabacillus fastidiosus]|uniref:hypothetical protein n=1 Tax=Metabacillus fastidiosus TaxID=1458 RepID=UPI003D2C5F4A
MASLEEIIREYDHISSSLDKLISQSQDSGVFKENDNFTAQQKELMELQRLNCFLQAENTESCNGT